MQGTFGFPCLAWSVSEAHVRQHCPCLPRWEPRWDSTFCSMAHATPAARLAGCEGHQTARISGCWLTMLGLRQEPRKRSCLSATCCSFSPNLSSQGLEGGTFANLAMLRWSPSFSTPTSCWLVLTRVFSAFLLFGFGLLKSLLWSGACFSSLGKNNT